MPLSDLVSRLLVVMGSGPSPVTSLGYCGPNRVLLVLLLEVMLSDA